MSVRFFYIDESFDTEKFCLSAIGIRHTEWRECFERVREHRRFLKKDYGIFLRKEIHAQEFVNGRGRVSDRVIGKHERSRIFEGLLRLVAQLPSVFVINICLDTKGRKNVQLDAWDRLTNRIERTLLRFEETELPLRRRLISQIPPEYPGADRQQLEYRLNLFRARGVIVGDQGREHEITRHYGGWEFTTRYRRISAHGKTARGQKTCRYGASSRIPCSRSRISHTSSSSLIVSRTAC